MTVEDILKALPTLKTERLILRKFSISDAEDLYEYASDKQIAAFGLWLPFNSLEDSQQFINEILENYTKGEDITWAIESKVDKKMIGRISLSHYSLRNARAEMDYAMNRKHWGKGLMTEAAKKVINFAFTTLNFNRIEAVCLPENLASIRVLEKNGMQLEGIKREYTFIRGKFDDLKLYSVLKREWVNN